MRPVVILTQIFLHVVFRLFIFFLRAKYEFAPGLTFEKGMFFISNHQSRLDPILIHIGIPFRQYLRLVPIYEMTAETYMDKWWNKLPMYMIGSIPINTSSKKSAAVGFYRFIEKIEQGETVMMFPEGKVTGSQKHSDTFPGAGFLVNRWKLAVAPVRVSGFSGLTWYDFFSRKRRARIVYGKSLKIGHADARRAASQIMNTIYTL